MTLIELVLAIVVMGICVVSVLSLLSSISVRSATTLARSQATSVAASYLEFILAQPYGNIAGYDGLSHTGAVDATGSAVVGLERYRVQVTARGTTLGSGAFTTPAMRVQVTVTDPTGAATFITGYRTNYSGLGEVLY